MPFELDFLDALQNLYTPWFNTLMTIITKLGDNGYVWIAVAAILLIIKKTRWIGVCIGLALIIDLVCVDFLLKPLIARARPFTLREVELLISAPSGFSFPSGHTASSFAAATAIAAFSHKKKAAAAAAYALACLIAFSRMYLFVHYPTDILGGAILGVMFGLAAVLAVRALRKRLPARRQKE